VSADFHKFPTTPHLAWLGKEPVRGDKVLTKSERAEFLAGEVAVEEKIDGANLGLSFSPEGELRFQNRGNWIEPPFRGQWQPLRDWAVRHEPALRELLIPGLILFGEWCYALHSLPYSLLPDWFLAFDVYDSSVERFWSRSRRDELLMGTDIARVPQLGNMTSPTIADLKMKLAIASKFGSPTIEGLYLRIDDHDWLRARAKLVNPTFVQSIEDHWSRSGIISNKIDDCTAGGKS
jgi:ATP-dependent RNA circularization protein (DNA/RNA ligase family)